MTCLLAFLILLVAAILGFLLAWFWRKNKIDDLNLSLDGERGRYRKLEGDYNSSISYGKQLEGDKKQLEGSIKQIRVERDGLNSSVLNLKSTLTQHEGEITGLKDERSKLNISLQDWQAKYRSVEGSLQEKTTAFNRAEKERTSLATRIDELEGKLSRKNTEAAEATQRASSLKLDFDRVFGERQSFATQLDHFKTTQGNQVETLEVANAGLLEERNTLTTQVESLRTENGDAILEINKLKAQLGAAQTDIANTKKAKEDLEYRYLSSEREREQLAAKVETESAALSGELTRLQALLSERAGEIEGLNASIGARANEKNQLIAETASLRTENKELQAKIESLNEAQSNASSGHADELERINAALNNSKGELERLRTTNTELKAQVGQLETDLNTASAKPDNSIELASLRSNTNGLKEDIARLRSQLATRREQSAEVARLKEQLANRPDDSAAVARLEADNASLLAELAPYRAAADKKKSSAADNERKRQEVLARIRGRRNQVDFDRLGAATLEDKDNLKRLRALGGFVEQKFNAIGIYKFSQVANFMKEDEATMNELLELPKNKIQKEDWVVEARRQLGLELDTDPGATLERVGGKRKKINFDRIGTASAANKDDLQRISDVSAFDEAKLNALGIYRFSQISSFSKKDTETVNESIEVFEGRIAREDWVGQAKQLAATSLEEVLERVRGRAANVDFSRIGAASGKDNLQTINGIGPFIEAKLNALGIQTFAQVARFNDADEVAINEAIELNAGHIQSDEWVRQAKGFAS